MNYLFLLAAVPRLLYAQSTLVALFGRPRLAWLRPSLLRFAAFLIVSFPSVVHVSYYINVVIILVSIQPIV